MESNTKEQPGEVKIQKSYFDVLGLCCSSEVVLIERILKPLPGVEQVSVIVPTKTVVVVHDINKISQLEIERALNQARLEATIRTYGTNKIAKKWPSPYIIACGVLLIVSLFHWFFRPLRWVALGAIAVGLPPIILRSIVAIRRLTLDINILMLIAVAGSVAIKDYTEAAFIVFLFTIAEWLESAASHKATSGMSALMSLAPQRAVLAETGQVVDVQDVKVDTVIAVKAGEVIPIDGIVVEGRSEVDERTLTGESFPVTKQPGSEVWAGTMNIDGYISVKTTALAENSTVAKMARLVEEAQNSRSSTQRLIDTCAKYYTPVVVVIAAGIAIFPLAKGVRNRKKWFELALVFLVSACPCALVLSTPVATFCSLLKAAKMGLLIKGGDILETLAKARVVAFDKTGTITRGEFIVTKFQPIQEHIPLERILYWVASIESKSSHPMASAVVDYARTKSIKPNPDSVAEFAVLPGEGVYGEIDGVKVYVGNKRIAARAGCKAVPSVNDIDGATVSYVFSDALAVGVFTVSDACRTGAAEAIRELKSLGIRIVLVTGDSTAAANYAQKQLGNAIDLIHAELLPQDKVNILENLKGREGSVIMVGDGMNDAPALAMADVGISMGVSGSAVAMETSHITLMSNDIRNIPKAIRLSKRTNRKIIINIILSIVTKVAIVALAIAGHPLVWAAVLADVGTCLVVIMNSMLLLRTRKPKVKKSSCCETDCKPCTTTDCCETSCASDTCASQDLCCASSGAECLHEEEGKCSTNCCETSCASDTCASQDLCCTSSGPECLHEEKGKRQNVCEAHDCHSDAVDHCHASDHCSGDSSDHCHGDSVDHCHGDASGPRHKVPEMTKPATETEPEKSVVITLEEDDHAKQGWLEHTHELGLNDHHYKHAACNHGSEHSHKHTLEHSHDHGSRQHSHKHGAHEHAHKHGSETYHEHGARQHCSHNSEHSHKHGAHEHQHKHASCNHASEHSHSQKQGHEHSHQHSTCSKTSVAHMPEIIGHCSSSSSRSCGSQNRCPSSGAWKGSSRCCRSYRNECCSGIVSVPEIVVE